MNMRSLTLCSCIIVGTAGIVACGGGGSGYSAPAGTVVPGVMATPSSAPTTSPGQTTTLATATLLGSAGFVNTNGRTVYVLSDDTVGSIACTVSSGCTGVWPPISPPNGVALSAGFTAFARADLGGAMQLAYNNHPLYQYAGDSAAAQTNGNGLVSFGGTWTVARP